MTFMKRALALLLAVVLTVGLLPAQVLADDFGLYPMVNLLITEHMYTASQQSGATIQWCYDETANIVIPDTIDGYPVVAIGDGAFQSKSIESVTIRFSDQNRYECL